MLFVDDYATALKTYTHCIYWLDSHNRDEPGLSVTCEMSALLKCRNLREVEKYIQVAFLNYRTEFKYEFKISWKVKTYSQYRLT